MKKLGIVLVLLVLGACGEGDTIIVGDGDICDVEGQQSAVIYLTDRCTGVPLEADAFKVDGLDVTRAINAQEGIYVLKCYDPTVEHLVTIQAEGYDGYLDAPIETEDVAFSVMLSPTAGCDSMVERGALDGFAACINAASNPVDGYFDCCVEMASIPEIAELCN